jgi:cytochrome c oxidase assembly protein subunit 15
MQPDLRHATPIARWLMLCLALIALMVAVGGVTRLTESGLSIVEWKLVSGTLPPLSDAAWNAEFEQYKTSPQYRSMNRDNFSVGDFKDIFWLEYLHRLLGRIIGLTIILPFVYFWMRGAFTPALRNRLMFICLLVAAQGTVGWVMVASGLVDVPRVAPIKLAAHLLLAFSLFIAILWTCWQVRGVRRVFTSRSTAMATRLFAPLLVLQIAFGALVAGLRAGLSYNTYPLMDGQLIPEGLHLLQPWWLNHLESILTVQFQHRSVALLVVAYAVFLAATCYRTPSLRRAAWFLLLVVFAQFTLGVATLISGVNIALASLHQLVALALLSACIWLIYLTPLNSSLIRKKNLL